MNTLSPTPGPSLTPGATLDAALERLARRRAGMRMGWIIHATVYVVVNLGLALLAGASGRPWAVYPAVGWGLGLALHGAAVLLAMPGGSLYQRLLDQERQRLQNTPRH